MEGVIMVFLGQFCDVAKVLLIQRKLSQIGCKQDMKNKKFKAFFYVFGYVLQPDIEIGLILSTFQFIFYY
jgi:hypothetical protein